MRINSLLTFLMLLQLSVFAQNKSKFLIRGHVAGLTDGTKIFLKDIDEQSILDSATTLKGSFTLRGSVKEPSGCRLEYNNESEIIMVENVKMTFEAGLKNEKRYVKTVGGREQDLQNIFDAKLNVHSVKASAYRQQLKNKEYTNESERLALLRKRDEANDAHFNEYVDFGKTHPNSFVGLDILYRNRTAVPKDSLKMMYSLMKNSVAKSLKGKSLAFYLNEQLVKEGQMMVDFEVKTIKGEPFKLSQLQGKFIYLAFGSAGCGACRIENKEISKNYDTISKGIAFVYFSLDKNLEGWNYVTNKDHIIWNNISDMEGEFGRIKTLYSVQAMPTSYLINKEGIVIKKFEGFEENLISVLQDLTASAK